MLKISSFQDKIIRGEIDLPASKSISHRYLIIRALSEQSTAIANLSDSNDTRLLQKALQEGGNEIDFEDAGTPMRFYLAYAALKGLQVIVTGNEGLKKRPVGPLVSALRQLGAQIDYSEKEGFLPVRIKTGIKKSNNRVNIDASVSSQFISALLLIAPYLDSGLTIDMGGEVVSGPYLALTMDCMQQAGIIVTENDTNLRVASGTYKLKDHIQIEADWSASSFFYALVAVSKNADLFLKGLRLDSLQGDRVGTYLFEFLGVQSKVEPNGIRLVKSSFHVPRIKIDFRAMPDMFPALVATCASLRVNAVFTSIRTLALKESDRIEAMRYNLELIGVVLQRDSEDQASLHFNETINAPCCFKSYGDHRIAMACSILASARDIEIDDETVVSKSFPAYWEQLQKLRILEPLSV